MRLNEHIRSKVIFKQHDLTRDPSESGYDLPSAVTWLFILTMKPRKLRRRFIDSLKINGVLFIGATETMLDATDAGFIRLSPCFYQKVQDVSRNRAAAFTR